MAAQCLTPQQGQQEAFSKGKERQAEVSDGERILVALGALGPLPRLSSPLTSLKLM